MRIVQKLIFLFGILCCTASVAMAEDLSGVYRADEFVPGSNDSERWKFLCARLPEILGQCRDQVLKSFGGGSRETWFCHGPKEDYLEYCISQKFNGDGTNTSCVLDLCFDKDSVCRLKIEQVISY